MHIALITDGIFPFVLGGMQKHSYYLAKYFAKNKIHIDIFHCGSSEIDESEVIKLFDLDERKYITQKYFIFPKKDFLPGHYLRESYLYSKMIFDSLKHNINDYDFIYTQGFSGWKLIEEKKRGIVIPPIAVNFHGYEMFQFAPNIKLWLQFKLLAKPVKFITKNANIVFSFGGKIDDILVNNGIKKTNIIHSYNGIDEDWLSEKHIYSSNKTVHFIYIGRYERRKGIEELNEVLTELISASIDFKFNFIGPIPENKKICSDKIKYFGSIYDVSIIKKIIKESDVLICPSHSEGMPTVILEAMASELSVIATDVGAISEMVNSETGWIISPHNKTELKNTILTAINTSKEEFIEKGKNAKKLLIRKFMWNIIVQKIVVDIQKYLHKNDL